MLNTQRATGISQPLTPGIAARAFHVEALATNTETVYIDRRAGLEYHMAEKTDDVYTSTGPSRTNKDGIPLARGEYVTLPGPRLDEWAMNGLAADKVYILPLLHPVEFTAAS